MKRWIPLLCAAALLLAAPARQALARGTGFFTDFSGGREGWSYSTAAPGAAFGETAPDGRAALSMTSDGSAEGFLRAVTGHLSFTSEQKAAVSFRFSADFSGDAEYGMRLLWGKEDISSSLQNYSSLLSMRKDGLRVGDDENGEGKTVPYSFVTDKEYSVAMLLDLQQSTMRLWLDGAPAAESTLYLEGCRRESIRFLLEDNYGANGPSGFYLYDFAATDGQRLRAYAVPAAQTPVTVGALSVLRVYPGAVLAPGARVALEEKQPGGGTFLPSLEPETVYGGSSVQILCKALQPEKTYRVTLSSLSTLMGEPLEQLTYVYQTAPEGYRPPEARLTAPAPDSVFRRGNAVDLNAQVTGGSEIQEVLFYVNGEQIGRAASPPYACVWTPSAEGEALLSVCAVDALGGRGESQAVRVRVEENRPPVVEMNLSPGKTDLAALSEAEAFAQDPDGAVRRVEAYLDGALVKTMTQAPYRFDLSSAGLGTHTVAVRAVDNEGEEATLQAELLIVRSESEKIKDLDFEGLLSGEAQSADIEGELGKLGLLANGQGGYLRAGRIDDSRGVSVLIGKEDGMTLSDSPYVGVFRTTAQETLHMKFDVYFTDLSVGGVINARGVRTDGKTVSHMYNVTFVKDKLNLYDGPEIAKSAGLETGKWYTMEYVPDFAEKTYDFYLDGVKLADGFSFRDPDYLRLEDNVRLVMNYSTNGPSGFTGLDNLEFSIQRLYPYVTGISGGAEQVPCDAETVRVKLSGEFEQVSPELVALYRDGREVTLKAVEKDAEDPSLLIITPAYGLQPSSRYRLALKAALVAADSGKAMGRDTTAYFTTTAQPFDVLAGEFRQEGGTLAFEARIRNQSQEEKQATVLVVYYDQGRIVNLKTKTVRLAQNQQITVSVEGEAAESAQACLFDGWETKVPINNNFYRYQR